MSRRRILRIAGMAALAALPAFQPAAAAAGWLCLSSAKDGTEIARRPLGADGVFELSFIHSVSKTPVRDLYRVTDGQIIQTAEVFQAHGAGLPSIANDMGATGWRHENGRFILDMQRPMGPIRLRVQAEYRNTLRIGGNDLPLASLGRNSLTLAPCPEETEQ